MNRIFLAAFLVGLITTCKAQGIGGMAEVAIIDRDTGAVLSAHFYRNEYWVAGKPGDHYAIEIRNRLGERLLAVTSVDGVNVVSGATAGWGQAGYVFGPGEGYQITGWRKTDAQVAAFTFTDSPNSYAARTGRTANIGVIGVAIFRERPQQPVYTPHIMVPSPPPMIGQPLGQPQSAGQSQASRAAKSDSAVSNESMAKAAPEPASRLGTGHGEREYSYVNQTEFVRMQTQPNEVIRIRYDSLDNLFAMGIVKRPLPPAPTANPFPASPDQQYVPDPRG